MEGDKKFLEGHTDIEKGAYLGAIASIAMADRQASEEEIQYLTELCRAADLSELQTQAVIRAANELQGKELTRCLDILKDSDLRFSLITDMLAFAKADGNYDEAEQENVSEIAEYLQVDQHQFSLLDQFADKAASTEVPPEAIAHPNFLSSIGLKDKLENEGIDGGSLLKSLASIAGPLVLGGMLARGMSGRPSAGSGGGMYEGGGLSSIIGMLSGKRDMSSMGGLLGRVLGRGGF
jgi:uncharacterized tellurite resistance protein B-like protein